MANTETEKFKLRDAIYNLSRVYAKRKKQADKKANKSKKSDEDEE